MFVIHTKKSAPGHLLFSSYVNIYIKNHPKLHPVLRYFFVRKATRTSFSCFILVFISADIIFHKFLELHSTYEKKKIFVTNFSFLTDYSLKPPTPTSHSSKSSKDCLFVCSLITYCITNREKTNC